MVHIIILMSRKGIIMYAEASVGGLLLPGPFLSHPKGAAEDICYQWPGNPPSYKEGRNFSGESDGCGRETQTFMYPSMDLNK